MNIKHCVFAAALVLPALGGQVANAGLGEPRVSVQSDAARLRGQVSISENSLFEVHAIQLASGTQVREYTGADGKVFAVAWSGPTMPNLKQTLGQYFDRYVAGAETNRLGHHHLQIVQSDFVVHAGGHMRAYSGVAYLPKALPEGVSQGDLK